MDSKKLAIITVVSVALGVGLSLIVRSSSSTLGDSPTLFGPSITRSSRTNDPSANCDTIDYIGFKTYYRGFPAISHVREYDPIGCVHRENSTKVYPLAVLANIGTIGLLAAATYTTYKKFRKDRK